MASAPRATVIVPSFEHADFVVDAVESALAQSVRDVEVLVIDDGSRDASRERLADLSRRGDPRLHVRLQQNRGLSRTLNRGLVEARGPWIKFLPSDDLLEPDCLARQLDEVAREPAPAAVFSLPTVVDAGGRALADPAPQAWFDAPAMERAALLAGLLERNFLCAPGALFSRDLARAVGGFDPSLRVAQDYDLWLRILTRAPGRLLPERLVRVRWHGGNQSAHATASTEAERAYALVHALATTGLDPWIAWLREARGGDGVTARLELAAALVRSGLLEVQPFARRLVGEARALGAEVPTIPTSPALAALLDVAPELTRPGPWGGIDTFRGAVAASERSPVALRARAVAGGGLASRLRGIARLARQTLARSSTEHPTGPASTGPRRARPEEGPRPTHWIVLAVVPIDDSGGGQRSAQLARALVRRGERVTYAARFPKSESVDLGIARAEHSPTVIEWDLDRIRAILAERDERIRVLAELPEAEVVGLAREARRIGARVLYDKIDAWERCDFATWYSRGDEAAMIGEADDLIGTARPLVRSLAAAKRPVHYLPNAVDLELFAPLPRDTAPPADAPRGDVNLVYAGALWGDWFDWDLIVAIAAARPSWTIALIGDPPRSERALPANVRLLGLKPQRALPAYLATADACLIPFRRTPLTEGVSPLKLFEYLAMRRPVIATRLGELAGAPYVSFVDDADRAVAAVERAVATPPPEAEIRAFLEHHTWSARAASLVSLTARPSIAVIVLRRGGPAALRGCLESLLAGRGEQSYRIAVVDDGSDGRDDEELAAREEAGEIAVLRSALRGNSASRNLGIRATQSELVAFVDAEQSVSGPGWLDAAVRLLVDDRRIGAVGSTGGWLASPDGRSGRIEAREEWSASPPSHARSVRTDVAYLGAGGLVVPRAVLARTQGFDERYDPRGCAGLDLSFQIREAGYALALSPDIGIFRPDPASAVTSEPGVMHEPNRRRLLAKWQRRPEYFAAPDAAGASRDLV